MHYVKNGIFKYKSGNDLTIVCFNFSFPQAIELSLKFEDKGYSPSLFSVSRVMHGDYSMVIKDLEKTNGLIIVDDSKSNNKLFYELLIKAHEKENSIYVDKIVRDLDEESYAPNSDIFKIDCDRVIARYEMHHND